MSTTLIRSQKCSWCDCKMHRGEKCWVLKSSKFDAHIKKLLSVICGNRDLHCPGAKMRITSFLSSGLQHNTPYCTDCGIFDLKFTKSGRTIVAPMRLSDEKFVKGSGVSGCDHYDGGYDNGFHWDNELEDVRDIKGFVVEDDICEESSTESEDESEVSDWSEEDDESDWSGCESD